MVSGHSGTWKCFQISLLTIGINNSLVLSHRCPSHTDAHTHVNAQIYTLYIHRYSHINAHMLAHTMHIHVYTCRCLLVRTDICIHIYKYTQSTMYMHICIHIYINTIRYMNTLIHEDIYTCVLINTHVYIHYMCTYTHMHMPMHLNHM